MKRFFRLNNEEQKGLDHVLQATTHPWLRLPMKWGGWVLKAIVRTFWFWILGAMIAFVMIGTLASGVLDGLG